jgi:acetyl esterase/lipase
VNSASHTPATSPPVELLWPHGAPGALGNEDADKPSLTVFLPPKEKRNGAAVVICPGGGYGFLAVDHEGKQVAEWFNQQGVAAFMLKYRIAPRYHHPAPKQDVLRALRTVRARATEWGVDVHRVGIIGFSAGGHLASTAGTQFDAGGPKSDDPIERQSSRPDFMILGYPVILFDGPYMHRGSRDNLLGKEPSEALIAEMSSERRVTSDTPPTFLFHTNEDTGVPPGNSIMFYLALRKAGVPAELHIYEKGPHGVGLLPADPVLRTWADRLADWLKVMGFLTPSK